MNARQRARRDPADVPDPAAATRPPSDPAGPGTATAEPLVSEDELESIRWAGYDAAIADAIAHRDRALESASERLDKVMRGGYLEYGQAIERADATFAAARRAAMHAHELGQMPAELAL